MCQPKSEGGKRCLPHAKLSQFFQRFIGVVTGASHELISETMSELNREAKAKGVTAHVSAAEVNALIDEQELRLDVNKQVSSHDRKILSNQLTAAREETKNGVDGNHFYVWRNILDRVRTKLRKAIISIGLIGSLAVGVAGCSAGSNPDTPTMSPTISSSASANPSPSTSTSTIPSIKLGDVQGTGKFVTDSEGTYETVKLDDPALLKYNGKIVDAQAKKYFTKEQIVKAQAYVGNFVASQTFDSTAVDSDRAGWEAWKKQQETDPNSPIEKNNAKSTLANLDTKTASGVIVNDYSNAIPVFIRDGKPRVSGSNFEITKITSAEDAVSGRYLYVTVKGDVEHRVDKPKLLVSLLKQNPGVTEAEAIKQYPILASDNTDPLYYKTEGTFSYAITDKKDNLHIGGYYSKFQSSYINLGN